MKGTIATARAVGDASGHNVWNKRCTFTRTGHGSKSVGHQGTNCELSHVRAVRAGLTESASRSQSDDQMLTHQKLHPRIENGVRSARRCKPLHNTHGNHHTPTSCLRLRRLRWVPRGLLGVYLCALQNGFQRGDVEGKRGHHEVAIHKRVALEATRTRAHTEAST